MYIMYCYVLRGKIYDLSRYMRIWNIWNPIIATILEKSILRFREINQDAAFFHDPFSQVEKYMAYAIVSPQTDATAHLSHITAAR